MAFPWALAVGGAATGAGVLGSLLNKPKSMSVPDISAELARIRAYYDQAAQVARQGIAQRAGEARTQQASNLAARGIYSSPVSQNVFGRLEQEKQRNLAESDAQIGLGSAQAQAGALGTLFGANQQAQQHNNQLQAQRQAAIYGGLGSLGSSLLGFGLSRPGAPGASPMNPPVGQPVGFGYGSAFPMGPWSGQGAYNLIAPFGGR